MPATGRAAGSGHHSFAVLAFALALTIAAPADARAQSTVASERKVLTIDDYALWRSIDGSRLSGDGAWAAWVMRFNNTLDRRPVLHLDELDTDRSAQIAYGTQPVFSEDSRWVAYAIELPYDEARRLRDAGRPTPRRAQLMDLRSGSTRTWEDVESFTFARDSRHLLLRRRAPDPRARQRGTDVVLHDLGTGHDLLLGSVAEASFNRSGELLAYTIDATQRDANALVVLDLRSGRARPLDRDTVTYRGLAWNERGTALAVLKGGEVDGAREQENTLVAFPDVYALLASPTRASPSTLTAAAAGFPQAHVISEKRDLRWSADGRLVFLGVRAQSAAPDTVALRRGRDELADVDVWHTSDERIQSVQMARAEAARSFTYLSAFDVRSGRFVVLADSTLRDVEPTADGRWAIGRDERGYLSDYEPPAADLYRVDTATGERSLIVRAQILSSNGSHVFGTSPDGRFFLYWRDGAFQLYDLDVARRTTLAAGGPDFTNAEFDYPGPRPPYGLAGWTRDGRGVVLLHRYDVWLAPVDGRAPVDLTLGSGEAREVRFRPVPTAPLDGLGPLERAQALAIDVSRPVLLSAFGQWTKRAGFFELSNRRLRELVYEDAAFGTPRKAARADRYLFTRETFVDFPDLHVAGAAMRDVRRITHANPQQAEFAWGRRMLIDFTNSGGVRLQAVLTLPDDYVPGERRPMLVTFYEKMSQNLHRHTPPAFLGSMGSIPVEAVSRGYITLQPDVHFNTGASHSDMLDAVEAATRRIIELGYADAARIGVHGHSYGGQGVAFIGTRSRLFAAVGMGAGVSDMTSDFSHNWGWSYQVRGRSGANAIAYYLYTQGRQGTNPWDDPELYRFESGRTHVREASAPFLIMHGTADPTVAFQEALGFYNALRFNGKSAILLAYPEEGHSLSGLANRRDFTIRYFQFFDHHLRGATAARWISEGVPYVEKDLRRDAAQEWPVNVTSQSRRN
jgi:dipeptidyl aminopeptidase/acylaminoacyl peptidase